MISGRVAAQLADALPAAPRPGVALADGLAELVGRGTRLGAGAAAAAAAVLAPQHSAFASGSQQVSWAAGEQQRSPVLVDRSSSAMRSAPPVLRA